MKYVEIAGLGCGFFGAAGSLWCLLDPCWKTTSQDLTVQPYDVCYGIWEGCLLPSDGSWVCDGYFGKTIIDQHVKGRLFKRKYAALKSLFCYQPTDKLKKTIMRPIRYDISCPNKVVRVSNLFAFMLLETKIIYNSK